MKIMKHLSITSISSILLAYSALSLGAFTTNLQVGSRGADVMALQKFLNTHGFQVTASGAGSPGNETTYFGAGTKAALAKYQAANGIDASGVLGPTTRAAMNATMTTEGANPGSTGVSGGFPAGCASATGYSVTTGASCSGPNYQKTNSETNQDNSEDKSQNKSQDNASQNTNGSEAQQDNSQNNTPPHTDQNNTNGSGAQQDNSQNNTPPHTDQNNTNGSRAQQNNTQSNTTPPAAGTEQVSIPDNTNKLLTDPTKGNVSGPVFQFNNNQDASYVSTGGTGASPDCHVSGGSVICS